MANWHWAMFPHAVTVHRWHAMLPIEQELLGISVVLPDQFC